MSGLRRRETFTARTKRASPTPGNGSPGRAQGMVPAAAVDAEASGGGALKGLVAGILLLGTALLIVANRVRRRHERTADAGLGATTG
ncbi:hypothetical protein ACFYRJ_40710 [Streptomyces sp. NPDC005531]|uniref:hypothetical protein n=1 Tax=Streptomyces sp. NPDC005531 TaxID=3364722 RepID=UPI0036A0063F